MKTYEELEREAYINGYMRLANLYGKIAQIEHDEYQIEYLKDEIYKLKFEADERENLILLLENDIEFYRQKAVRAEGKLEEIAAKIEE